MEQDTEHHGPSVHETLTKTKLLSSKTVKEYGTIRSFEVDAAIPIGSFDSTSNNSHNSQEMTTKTSTAAAVAPVVLNGSSLEEGIPFHRRNPRSLESRMDENGNPFGVVNGTSSLLQRTSPPGPITTTSTMTTTTTTNSTSVAISTSKFTQRSKNKKKGENVLYADNLPGHVGNLVSFVQFFYFSSQFLEIFEHFSMD